MKDDQKPKAELIDELDEMRQRIADLEGAEVALRENAILFNRVPITLYRTSPEGKFLDFNLALLDLLGFPDRETALETNIVKQLYLKPEDRTPWKAILDRDGILRNAEMQVRRYDGTVIWVKDTARIIRDEAGETLYYEGSLEDISERKQTEKALAEANAIVNRSPAVVFLWKNEAESPVEFVSENVKEVFGYTQKEFLEGGVTYEKVVHVDDLERVTEEVDSKIIKEEFQTFAHLPYRIVTKGGDIKWVDDRAFFRRNSQGIVTHYEGIVLDITERMRAEEAFHASKEQFEKVIMGAPNPMVIIDENQDIVLYNNKFTELYGYTLEDISTAEEWWMTVYPDEDYRQKVRQSWEMAVEQATKTAKEIEMQTWDIVTKDGAVRHVEFQMTPLDEISLIAMNDITERKEAEEALHASKEQFEKVIMGAPNPMVITDENQDIVLYNNKFTELYGYTLEDISTAEVWWQTIYPDEEYRQKVQQSWEVAIAQAIKAGKEIEMQTWDIVIKDGAVRHVEFQMTPLGEISLIAMNDITERKRAEERIQERNRYLTTLNAISIAINESKRLDEFLEVALQQIVISTRVDGAEYHLLDDDGFLSLRKTWKLDETFASQSRAFSFAAKEGIPGRAFERCEPVYVANAPTDSRYLRRKLAEAAGYRSLLCVPILGRETNLGTIMLYSHEAREFSSEIQDMMMTIGGQLGVAAERLQAEEILDAQKQRLENILQGTNAGTWDWDIQTDEITLNHRWAEIIGRTLEELEPSTIQMWIDNVHPEDLPVANTLLEKHFNGELDYYDTEFRQPHKDGGWVWVHARGKVVEWGEDGEPLRMSGIHLDITERKQAEEALRVSKEQFEIIAMGAPVPMVIRDDTQNIVLYNDKFTEIFGYTLEDISTSEEWWQTIYPDENYRQIAKRSWRKVKSQVEESGIGSGMHEQYVTTKDGFVLHVEFSLTPLGDISVVLINDITERRQAEKRLENQRQRLENILQGTNAGTWDWEIQTGEIILNHRWAEIIGFTLEELPSVAQKIMNDTLHPEDLPAVNALLDQHFKGELDYYDIEFRQQHKAGEWVWVHARGKVVEWGEDGEALRMSGIHLDITERKQDEAERERLLTSEQEQRILAEALSEGTLAITSKSDIESMLNEILTQSQRLIPFKTGNIMYLEGGEMHLGAWVGYDFENLEEFFFRVGQDLPPIEKQSIQSGVPKIILDVLQEPDWMTFEEIAWIKSWMGVPICLQDEVLGILRLDSDKIGSFSIEDATRLQPLLNAAAVAIDKARLVRRIKEENAERKMAEEKVVLLNQELEQRVFERTAELSATIKEIESFSYSVSHDLRAPLRAINGFSEILMSEYAENLDQEMNEYLNKINQASKKMDDLIGDMLSLTSISGKKFSLTSFSPDELATQVFDTLKKTEDNREIEFHTLADSSVIADNGLIKILLTNLISNAIKFTREEQPAVIEFGSLEEEGRTVFYLRDNGIGMNMEYADKIFSPFHRLHGDDEFEGTGIGLAIAYRIVQRHKGEIWAESEEGEGTTIYFSLGSDI